MSDFGQQLHLKPQSFVSIDLALGHSQKGRADRRAVLLNPYSIEIVCLDVGLGSLG